MREKETHESDDHKEDDFPHRIEKYSRYSEGESKEIYYIANFRVRESEFEETEMQVMRLISLHRIFSFQDAKTYDIDEIDEIDTDHRHSRRDLSSCDDSECRDEEGE